MSIINFFFNYLNMNFCLKLYEINIYNNKVYIIKKKKKVKNG